ncbi:MAG: OmpP1/FadL family transporter [Saprospiraceae bacterium]
MMKSIYGLLFAFFCLNILQAQTAADVLRFSYLDVGGTARTVGVGGAIGALGGDFATLSTNPAGLAVYRRSEFVLTPTLFNATTVSTLEGAGNEAIEENKTNFNLNNIGIILTAKPKNLKWQTSNIGIGLNRRANFNNNFYFEGKSKGSITTRFVELANTFGLDEFEAGLADSIEAIFIPNVSGEYIDDIAETPDLPLKRTQNVIAKGSINELVFSLAGNYDNKIMIGATIGVPFFSYSVEKEYTEEDVENGNAIFNSLRFTESIRTNGVGVNLKLGLIYRINQMFRLGAAIHTPTAVSLTDKYNNTLTYDYTFGANDGPRTARSIEGISEYSIRTPWRAIGSLGVIIKKYGFLTAEVEWVDYRSASINFDNDREYEREVNGEIEDDFKSTLNIRLGGEYAYEIFRFRAGFGINGTPYADDDIINTSYSLGLGLRERQYYIDFAYRGTQSEEAYIPYRLADTAAEQRVSNDLSNGRFMLTFGYRF